MKRLVLTTLVAATSAVCLVSNVQAQSASSPVKTARPAVVDQGIDARESFEAGYAEPGSAVHRWVASLGYTLSDDHGFRYTFYSTNAKGGAFVSLLSRLEKAGDFGKSIQFDPPQPTQGGQIGETWSNNVPCLNITDGGQQGTASITIQWERRYTVDSDDDGTNDSNPQWVVSGFSTPNVEWFTNGAALCP